MSGTVGESPDNWTSLGREPRGDVLRRLDAGASKLGQALRGDAVRRSGDAESSKAFAVRVENGCGGAVQAVFVVADRLRPAALPRVGELPVEDGAVADGKWGQR